MPDAAWAVSGIFQANPEGMATPRFWHRLIRFRHVISGLLALALSTLPDGILSPVSATLTTIAFDDSSLRWLEINT